MIFSTGNAENSSFNAMYFVSLFVREWARMQRTGCLELAVIQDGVDDLARK